MSTIIVLAIESSCDETAISVVRSINGAVEILSSEISSQVKLHSKWGGVVPNLAAREHLRNITPLLNVAFQNANIEMKDIDMIATTQGPGLIPALLVGNNFAKTLAYLCNKPLIGIHHIEGHIYANFVNKNQESGIKNHDSKFILHDSLNIKFPILCLVVSGGHTQLVFMKDHLKYEIVGQTLDDAAGEAFDKVARILGIGYPGGPAVARYASKFQETINKHQTNSNNQGSNSKKNTKYQIPDTRYQIHLPRPMLSKKNFDFSFSGLKTAVLYETKRNSSLLTNTQYLAEICHEFQQAAIDVLITKTLRAAEKYKPKTIMLAGGVSANKELREQLGRAIAEKLPDTRYQIPDTNLTGDNAAMIGIAAAFRWEKMSETQKKKLQKNWSSLQPDANLKLK